MRQRIKTHVVAFRLDEKQWRSLDKAAEASGENPNDWCRRLAVVELDSGHGLSRNERLIYEEVSRIRFLLGEGFYLLASDELTLEEWNQARKKAQEQVTEISRHLLTTAQTSRR